jgi:hypothetical protein
MEIPELLHVRSYVCRQFQDLIHKLSSDIHAGVIHA